MATGNAALSAIFRAAIRIAGRLASQVGNADAGTFIRRRFCPACGTPLFADDPARPETMVVHVSALDERQGGRPQSTIWAASAPGRGHADLELPSYPAQPAG